MRSNQESQQLADAIKQHEQHLNETRKALPTTLAELQAEPAPLPDNWNEWVKEEAGRVYREAWVEISPGHHRDTNFAPREVWKSGATSMLNKLQPELERLEESEENHRILHEAAVSGIEIYKNLLQEKDKEISRLKGLLHTAFIAGTEYGYDSACADIEGGKRTPGLDWKSFCQQHNIDANS